MSDYNPLVSVVVITYNSCKYVRETLESAKMQTYRNIELIVTDDGSTDATVDICRKWLEANGDRFVRTELITVARNTGIPANCNRGYKACKGEWIKGIAGDDALLPDCIQDYVNFVFNRPEIKVCYAIMREYRELLDENCFIKAIRRNKITFPLSATKQYKLLSMKCWITAPSVFFQKSLIEELGYFDESIPFCEDYPFWLKLTQRGHRFYFLDKETIKYRRSIHSISARESKFINDNDHVCDKAIYLKYLTRETPFTSRAMFRYRIFLYNVLERFRLNNRNKQLNRFCYFFLSLPYRIINYLQFFYFVDIVGVIKSRINRLHI